MKTTKILATKETVKALECMDFQPIKILETLGYSYTGDDKRESEREEWKEHCYTGVNPDNPGDVAVVTVGERDDRQYIYLENEDRGDWRYIICVNSDNRIEGIYKINTPTEALCELEEEIVGKKADWLVALCDVEEDDMLVDWDDICTAYDLQLHGTSYIENGDAKYEQIDFNTETRVAVLYVATEGSPEVTLYIDDDGEIYDVK